MTFIKQAWSSASRRVVMVPWCPPESPAQALFTTTREASLFLLKGTPPCPALTHPTALADLNTLNLRADPGAQPPAIAAQN